MIDLETLKHGGSNRGRRVCVVGGGIGGLTAALAFRASGADVQVFEQAEDFTEVGAGIQITPNGVRVLDALGLGPFLSRIGVVSNAVVPVDGVSGRAIARFDLRAQSPSYHFVHRAKLIDLLAGACMERGIALNTGCRVVSAEPDGTVTFSDLLGDAAVPKKAPRDLVVFADGIKSIGRLLTGNPTEATFAGQVAWRAIVAGHMAPEAEILMGAGRHMVVYPLGENQINIVAVQERDAWAEEGWSHRDDPDNLRRAFASFSPQARGLLDQVEDVNLWGLFRHPVARNWHSGHVAILGDAAHPTLPFLAQGANLAIEDAMVLAQCCDGTDDIKAGFERYENLRKPRVTRAIAAANANAQNYHLSGFKRTVAHMGLKTLGKVAPNAFINRLDWLYGYDATRPL